MSSPKKESGLESLSIGYLLIAFAVAILIGWWADRWWLVIPVFMIEAGIYYLAAGFYLSPKEGHMRKERKDSLYYIFWGGSLGLLGAIWLLNWKYPDNVPLLVVIFIIWLGSVVIVLSLPRFRGGQDVVKQQ